MDRVLHGCTIPVFYSLQPTSANRSLSVSSLFRLLFPGDRFLFCCYSPTASFDIWFYFKLLVFAVQKCKWKMKYCSFALARWPKWQSSALKQMKVQINPSWRMQKTGAFQFGALCPTQTVMAETIHRAFSDLAGLLSWQAYAFRVLFYLKHVIKRCCF